MRRKRMHGKKRRKSSYAPFKHTISMKAEDQHPHDKDGNHLTEAVTESVADSKKAATEDTKFEESPSWWERNYGEEASDAKQDTLTLAGTSPGVIGMGADAANTIISGGRLLYNAVKGDWNKVGKHAVNVGLNATSFVPGTEAVAIGRLSQSQALANTGTKVYDEFFKE